jgi:hypothetical protein
MKTVEKTAVDRSQVILDQKKFRNDWQTTSKMFFWLALVQKHFKKILLFFRLRKSNSLTWHKPK